MNNQRANIGLFNKLEMESFMGNQLMDTKNYINEPDKGVKLGRFIGPILLYYVMTLLAQIIWGVCALPKVLLKFIQGNDELLELMPESFESLGFLDLLYEFMLVIEESLYFDFLYELTSNALENIAVITILSAALAIPFFLLLMGRDRRKNRVYIFNKELKWKFVRYGWIFLGSIVMCVALNNMITLSNLEALSDSYEETSTALFSIGLPLQIFGLGVVVPIFEELLYRGVFYNRLKVNLSKYSAIWVSAAIFGTMHGNLVQFIYAFILGIVFAWLYEVYKSLWAPILGHVCMNLTSVFLSQGDIFEWIFAEPIRVGIVTVCCATSTAAIYVVITNIISAENKAA